MWIPVPDELYLAMQILRHMMAEWNRGAVEKSLIFKALCNIAE
jgi:hypothetical protein